MKAVNIFLTLACLTYFTGFAGAIAIDVVIPSGSFESPAIPAGSNWIDSVPTGWTLEASNADNIGVGSYYAPNPDGTSPMTHSGTEIRNCAQDTLIGGNSYTIQADFRRDSYVSGGGSISVFAIWDNNDIWRRVDGSWAGWCAMIMLTSDNSWDNVDDIRLTYEVSDSVEVDQAKQISDGSDVSTSGIVTASFKDHFYIESLDRSSGIRVEKANHGMLVAHVSTVTGVMATRPSGERYISADSASQGSDATAAPLGMNTKTIGGGGAGAQTGVAGGYGLNNIGLLVRTTGRVSNAFSKSFNLDDGSGVVLKAATETGGNLPANGSYAIVTGIASCEKDTASNIQRVVEVTDLQVLQGGFMDQSVIVEVTGGNVASTDKIVEQQLDFSGIANMLGLGAVDPVSVRLAEISAGGEDIANVFVQVDPTDDPAKYILCWCIPGRLDPGQTRRFRATFNGGPSAPAPTQQVTGSTVVGGVSVTNGGVVTSYSSGAGGVITHATINGAPLAITWGDKVYDGAEFKLATHSGQSLQLTASGPLRVACEAKSDFLNGSAAALSHPKGTYRFTHYAAEPVVTVCARVDQDFSYSWTSAHMGELHFDPTVLKNYATDKNEAGTLSLDGRSHVGKLWSAVYDGSVLLGMCNSVEPNIYDNGDSYIQPAWADPWSSASLEKQWGLLFAGASTGLDLLRTWSPILADPPRCKVSVASFEQEIQRLTGLVDSKFQELQGLDGTNWAAAYIAVHVVKTNLSDAATSLANGDIGNAEASLLKCRELLEGGPLPVQSQTSSGVISGTVGGYPFLMNNDVAYFWAKPADGAGLLSVYDRNTVHEFLQVAETDASLWNLSVKKGEGGKAYSNTGMPCVIASTSGGLDMTWTGSVNVTVHTSLSSAEKLARMRLSAVANVQDEGIQMITFPSVRGIVPITNGGSQDHVLDTHGLGDMVASPLVTGNDVSLQSPASMQFTALLGDGKGLYFAEYDPNANLKSLTWTTPKNEGVLDFAIGHAVLNARSTSLVKTYASPGDVCVGPFRGDWYDAAQLYRDWAITAPWCSKGTMLSRADYPQWLAQSPNWTISYAENESYVDTMKTSFQYYGIPVGVTHTYGYFFAKDLDDRHPEFAPPKLGSQGLRQIVDESHAIGLRMTAYVNGRGWDADTESYTTENAAQNCARQQPDGGVIATTAYGLGQKSVIMCPGAPAWQQKLVDVSKELVGRYDFDGVYYDWLTTQVGDCFNTAHGHAIGGGDFWASSIRSLYGQCRTEIKTIRPDAMMTGEGNTEFVIDLLDTALVLGIRHVGTKSPLFEAVYHGYTLVYGGAYNTSYPCVQGRWWLMGNQGGWYGVESLYAQPPDAKWRADGDYYRKLIRCHYLFGQPYLAYGRMLRMPQITGDVPTITVSNAEGQISVPAVEATAWEAPDGSVGIFILNYDEVPHAVTWSLDVGEAVGWDSSRALTLSVWTEQQGLTNVGNVQGGRITRSRMIEGRGMFTMKLVPAN